MGQNDRRKWSSSVAGFTRVDVLGARFFTPEATRQREDMGGSHAQERWEREGASDDSRVWEKMSGTLESTLV